LLDGVFLLGLDAIYLSHVIALFTLGQLFFPLLFLATKKCLAAFLLLVLLTSYAGLNKLVDGENLLGSKVRRINVLFFSLVFILIIVIITVAFTGATCPFTSAAPAGLATGTFARGLIVLVVLVVLVISVVLFLLVGVLELFLLFFLDYFLLFAEIIVAELAGAGVLSLA
jgi:hypothetical protein